MPETVGILKIGTLLTAKLFEPKDKSLSIDFLRAHPVTTHPKLYREIKGGRRRIVDRAVTDAFCKELVDTLVSSQATFSLYKYHHSGTGTTNESAAHTALVTPVETSRDVGSQVDEDGDGKIYKSVATTTYTASRAITEHAVFNTAGTGDPATGGDMMDRSKFDAINVVSGNQIEWTYELTVASGS